MGPGQKIRELLRRAFRQRLARKSSPVHGKPNTAVTKVDKFSLLIGEKSPKANAIVPDCGRSATSDPGVTL